MNSLRRIAVAAAVLAISVVVSTATAHETWLQPISFYIDAPARQIVHMTSGMGEHYAAPDSPIDPARVVRSGVWFAGGKLRLTKPTKLEHELALTWTPPKKGIASIYVDLAAKVLNLPDSLINEYFDEIGASPELRKQWTDTPSPKKWRESYVKHAKTYVRVGDATTTYAWRGSMGMDLEIVPLSDPTRVIAGDTLWMRVLFKGKPLSKFTVAAYKEGTQKPGFLTTDTSGRAGLVVNSAGQVLVAGVHLRRVHEPSLEWRSDFTSMTLRVMPRK